MGPYYQVATTANLKNTWVLNNGIESINVIFFWLLDNNY